MLAIHHLRRHVWKVVSLRTLHRGGTESVSYSTSHINLNTSQRHIASSVAEEPLPPPSVEGESKTYPPKIVQLVDDIAQLSLLEVADLNELLKIKLNISDIPMMSAAAPVATQAADGEEEAAEVKEQTEFAVKLTAFNPDSKVKVIKAIKSLIPDCNLVKAKGFVESVPQMVKRDLSKEEAEEIVKILTEAGGTAVME